MAEKVYVETTIVSYLTARPSAALVTAGHQRATQQWWSIRRATFELFVSEVVVREAGAGDQEVASRRLALLRGIPELTLTPEVLALAQRIVAAARIPSKAEADALHIAVATVHGMDSC